MRAVSGFRTLHLAATTYPPLRELTMLDGIGTHAEAIGGLAIDVSHGCHLAANRFEVMDYVTEAATSMNADPDVVDDYGLMPLPTALIEHSAAASTVAYADGSALRFTWGDDGYAVTMAVHPVIGEDAVFIAD